MQRPILFVALLCIAATVCAQRPTFSTLPPTQPPIILNPPPPPLDRIDLKTGKVEPAKICTREAFTPCPDERSKNCFRKETYRCPE